MVSFNSLKSFCKLLLKLNLNSPNSLVKSVSNFPNFKVISSLLFLLTKIIINKIIIIINNVTTIYSIFSP